jgi:hypothetical protein
MGKVKIYLDEGETLEEAEEDLQKALNFHSSGEIHDEDSYQDPAMRDLTNLLEQLHKKAYDNIIREVIQALDKDYTKNGNV